MATNLGELLSSLASQVGLDTNSQDVQAVLTNDSLKQISLSDEVAGKFKTGLLTLQSAKNHTEINQHFRAKHLNAVDRKLQQELKKLNVSQEIFDELEGIQDTYGRIEYLFPKLEDHYKSLSKGKKGDEEYQAMVNKYNTLVQEKQQLADSLKNKQTEFEREREQLEIGFEVNSALGGYTLGEAFKPEDVRLLVNTKLSQMPYVLKKANGSIGVFQKDQPDLKAMKENKELSLKDLLDDAVQPYIKKAGGSHVPPAGSQQPPPPPANKGKLKGAGSAQERLQKFREKHGEAKP